MKISIDGSERGQLSPDEMRRFGLTFIEAAEAAEHDAAVFAWLREKMDMSLPATGAIIGELRSWRGTIHDRWEEA